VPYEKYASERRRGRTTQPLFADEVVTAVVLFMLAPMRPTRSARRCARRTDDDAVGVGDEHRRRERARAARRDREVGRDEVAVICDEFAARVDVRDRRVALIAHEDSVALEPRVEADRVGGVDRRAVPPQRRTTLPSIPMPAP